jgi:hypothetical protein
MFEAAEAMELIVDVIAFREHGVMPNAGGRHDQDPRWLQAADIFGVAILEIEAARGETGST